MEAKSLDAARNRLRTSFPSVDSVRRTTRWSGTPTRLSTKTLAVFFRQLSFQLQGGVPIAHAVEISMYGDDAALDNYLWQIADRLREGWALSMALGEHEEAFSPVAVAVVKVGEETGRLPACLDRLAEGLARLFGMQQKLLSDLTYPVSLAVLSLVLLGVMSVYAIPQMEEMFSAMGISLPPLTRAVLFAFHALTHPLTVGLTILGIAVVTFWLRRDVILRRLAFRAFEERASQVAALRALVQEWWLPTVLNNLALVLDSGVALLPGLDLVATTAPSPLVAERLQKVRLELIRGATLSEALAAHKVMPRLAFDMICIGEQSGKLAEMMRRTVTYYDRQLEHRLEILNGLLGPLLLMIVGGAIGVVAVAMMLPFFQVISIL